VEQQPGPGSPGQGRGDRLGDLLQRRGPALVTHRQPGDLLDERGLGAVGVLAVQAPYRHVDHHRSAADRLVGDVPHVPAVLPVGGPAAARTRNGHAIPGARHDPDQLRARPHPFDLHRSQLRQQGLQLDVRHTTRLHPR
jgi:hypothetical protein